MTEVWTAEDYKKYLAEQKPSKYHNKRVKLDGFTFDSQAEANRFAELRILQAAGEIQDLEVHPRFKLQSNFAYEGKLYPAIYYEADFKYVENGRVVTEDVKGMRTPVFNLKLKLFLFRYPSIKFRLVGAATASPMASETHKKAR